MWRTVPGTHGFNLQFHEQKCGLRIPRGSFTNLGTGHQCQKTPGKAHFLRPFVGVLTVTSYIYKDRRGPHLVSNNLLTCSTFNFRGATTNIMYENKCLSERKAHGFMAGKRPSWFFFWKRSTCCTKKYASP